MDNHPTEFDSRKSRNNGSGINEFIYFNNWDNNALDAKELIQKYLRHWPWLLTSVIVCLAIAFLYLRYTNPVYHISSKILIKSEKNAIGNSPAADVMEDLDIFNSKNSVDDEEEIIHTKYLMRKVVDELNLNINYYIKNNFKTSELYKNAPFKVTVLSLKDSVPAQNFDLRFDKVGGSFHLSNENTSGNFHFGDTIRNSLVSLTLTKQPFFINANSNYTFVINTPQYTTEMYSAAMTSEIISKSANVIQLSILETVPRRGEDILNKLYEIYTRVNLENKYEVMDSTIRFIDDRLAIVGSELAGVEKNIEQFKTSNKISMDLRGQNQLALNDASDLRKRMVVQEVQIGMVQALEDHIRNNTGRVVPYASDIKDPMYISSVEKYNNLVLERDRQLLTTKPENPLVENLNSQIEILQKDLLTSLENVKLSMLIAQNELGKLNNQVVGDIQSTPSKERAMLDISRQQDVKQQLYLYLLQKREQTAIAKSGTLANSILIEPAQGDLQPIKPKAQLVYWAALIVGLLIPGAILFFVTLFDNKVREKKDITNATQATILGEIGHKKNHDFLVARQNSKTVLSEQFRTIRTNLGFTLNNKHDKVIMVTSGMNEEGKTFCSVNLATSLATSNKKVVLMDLDLRKPGVARALGIRTNKGFTAYMACKIDKEHVAESTDIHPKLFWIGSGQISYNPDELLLQERLAELFDYLKAEFDYIIVDTPPIGLVSDAVLIGKYADATIYILRQNFSLIRQLDIINDLLINTKVPGLCILVNDIKAGRGFSYGYGYVYNSNGYTMNEAAKKTHFWKKSNA